MCAEVHEEVTVRHSTSLLCAAMTVGTLVASLAGCSGPASRMPQFRIVEVQVPLTMPDRQDSEPYAIDDRSRLAVASARAGLAFSHRAYQWDAGRAVRLAPASETPDIVPGDLNSTGAIVGAFARYRPRTAQRIPVVPWPSGQAARASRREPGGRHQLDRRRGWFRSLARPASASARAVQGGSVAQWA